MAFPLAYFITFRTYGTWLHGDERGWVDPRHNRFGSPIPRANATIERRDLNNLTQPIQELTAEQIACVDRTIRAVCAYKGWMLKALNVRSNHVHAVVAAACLPEPIMNTFKAWATRRMREAGLIERAQKVWARHGSTIYLWIEERASAAWHYTMHGQGESLTETRP